ncbi:hypothetical protein BN946_scf184884.g47 [Trametes cinnabarina]|uniref:DUF6534 domain-containing protein n=1 Tax=Pycnoporus cinnabarinus TaxID=5643 RepID=A0A060SBY5_PYCCI|nr:hypothetical protein BN946_scf184884.g47 [Trametes cinnabarina]
MAPPAGQALGDTYGVMLISTVIAAGLYGVTFVLSLYYYDKFPKDPFLLKLAVAIVWFLDTASIVLDVHAVYYYLIANYNNPPALLVQVWSVQVELLITYTAVFFVQIFFIQRIYQRVSVSVLPVFNIKSTFSAAKSLVHTFTLGNHNSGILRTYHRFKNSTWNDVQSGQVNRPLVANWLTGLIVDVSITVVLCWYLWSEKNYVRRGTRRLINRIIIFSVNRGAIAARLVLRDMITDGELGGSDFVLPTIVQDVDGKREQHPAPQVTTLEFAVARSSTFEPQSFGAVGTEDITDVAEKSVRPPSENEY